MGTTVEMIAKAEKNGNPSYAAIGKIMLAWNLSYLTDCYGSIPYTEAFKAQEGLIKPKYDSQEDVYKQIQTLLDQAIVDAGKGSGAQPTVDDFVYGGAMQSWIHLANTLKARFYLRLSNAPGYSAATQANLALTALAAGAITAAEAPRTTYYASTNSDNPWYQYAIDGKWSTAPKPSIYYIDLLQSSGDPRLAFQVTKVPASTPAGPNDGTYAGVTNDAAPLPLGNYSSIGPFYSAKDAKLNLLLFSEVHFIRAEAEFLKAGKVVNANVITAYNAGIKASMDFYGIVDYAVYAAANAITIATPSAEAYRRIMTQKYIANFLQFEAYNDYRRTGYPALPVNDEVYPGEPLDVPPFMDIVPLRFPYPSSERSYNAGNIPADIPLNPTEAMAVPLWWDK
ncbi:Starch-binding associating with outer membrane [compost metagenome]